MEHAEEQHAETQRPPGDLSWSAPAGLPVYGLTPGTPPPNLQSPWEFQQPRPAPMVPAAPGGVVSIQPLAPAQPELASPPPQPMEFDWERFFASLPSPLGPALTPEERFAQLHPGAAMGDAPPRP